MCVTAIIGKATEAVMALARATVFNMMIVDVVMTIMIAGTMIMAVEMTIAATMITDMTIMDVGTTINKT
jgi:hypothetical protein